MADKIVYGNQFASMTVTGGAKDIIKDLIRSAEPALMKSIESAIEELKADAIKNWPVRKTTKNRDGSIRKGTESEGSRELFETTLRIIPPATIVGSVKNNASYAWAIRSGQKQVSTTSSGGKIPVKPGARVADVLLWKPAKKHTKKLLKLISDSSIKNLKRKGGYRG